MEADENFSQGTLKLDFNSSFLQLIGLANVEMEE
jgi:hypothetical protein